MVTANRLSLAREAVRPSLKARLMLSGPAGAGKTFSALEIASVLGERILLIDTEKESALTYASEFAFTHLPWAPPFDPRELGATLVQAAADYDVIVVDSLSHFWGGQGGTLDIADGKFGGWKTARPAQNDAVDGILSSPAHVIVCVRSAIEHVQELDTRTGKQVVRKLGLAPKQDKDLEYELNLAVEIDIDHRIAVAKSRTTAIPVGQMFAPGHARDLGNTYKEWLAGGEPFADLEVRADIDRDAKALTGNARAALLDAWRNNGLPRVDLLTESQAARARVLIDAARSAYTETSGAGQAPDPTDGATSDARAAGPEPAGVVEDSGAGEAEGEAAEPAPANRRGNRDGDDPAKSQDGLWKALQAGLADWQRRTDATRPQVLLLVSSVLDREVATTTDLTVSDAHRVLDALKGNPA